MKKLTVNEQEELFAQDCKLINLRYEYSGFTGTEKWAIITELSEEALWDKYPDVISRYTPFILLSMAQGEVISESHRNNDKYEKRSKRTIDVYGYEDDIFEQFHPKSIAPFIDPFDKAEEEQIEEEKEKLRQLELSKVRQALSMLQPVQRERLLKSVLLGISSRKIAKEEGINYSSVDKSIAAAIKNFKKFYENAFEMLKEEQEESGQCDVEIDGMTGFIFCNRFGNVPNPQSVNRAIKRIIADYNATEEVAAKKQHREAVLLPDFSAHHLRHTFCTRLCENETNLKVIQSVMGHKDIQTTMDVYAEATEQKKQESFERLAAKLDIF